MHTCGFVTISDHRYFPGVRALVNSIRANSPAPVTVIDEGLTADQRAWLANAGVETRRVARSIPVDDPRFGCCYALFDIDAAPYDRIICIDPDAIVLEDIRTLFASLDKKPIAAASSNLFRTLTCPDYQRKLRHVFPPERLRFLLRNPRHFAAYFTRRHAALCSGTVAVRREVMPRLRAAAVRYADFFTSFKLPDQDLLSLCIADLDLECALLPYEMNAATLHVLPDTSLADEALRRKYRWISENVAMRFMDGGLEIKPNDDTARSFELQKIRVLHYAGPDKPWKSDAQLRAGFREIWQHYHGLDLGPDTVERSIREDSAELLAS